MPSRKEALKVARRLHGLSGGPGLVRRAAARELAARHPLDANELIAELIRLAQDGDEPSRCVLRAVVQALHSETDLLPHGGELRRLASVQSLHDVVALLADDRPHRQMDPDAAARQDARVFTESLGHLKTKARVSSDPDVLSRVATVSEPTVMRNLLLNPRLTEALVVRIASRRPARPEPLLEIWRSPKWSSRPMVRRALVFNPYLPPEIGSKIVPLLSRADLRELVGDAMVHHALRAQARLLLKQPSGPTPDPRGQA